jgi:DNA-binding transcriptional regulator YbjK
MLVEDAPAQTDGRRRRSQQSRDRIIAAMMALVEEGQISPIAEQVAERAQVGLRSVFRHFNDMDSLFAEMAMRLTRHYQTALAPFASADWQGRLGEAIDRRVGIYEALLPYKRAADAHRHTSAAIQSAHAQTSQLLRARLKTLLPPHLENNADAFEALDFLLSMDSWQRLRLEQKLSVETARAIIEAQIKSVVG